MQRQVLTLHEASLRRRASIKWRHFDPDVLPLWVAEMDVATPPPVAQELRRIVADGDLGYPVATPYLEAIARWYATWGADVDPARITLATDVMSGVKAALIALTDPGDPVYITVPVYPPFHSVVAATGRSLVQVPLGTDGRLDVPALERAFAARPGVGAFLMSNPHNPTGSVPTHSELVALARAAATHGIGMVSDEVHAPLVLPGTTFTPLLSVPEAAGAMAVISPAKGWNLAGLKAGAIVAGPDGREALGRVPRDLAYTASHVAIRAHIAAMDHGGPWLSLLLADLAANRVLLTNLLAEHLPGVDWSPGEATYLAWLDCRRLGLGDDPARYFLERARVGLTAGPPFGAGEGFARLNFATSPEMLERAVTRMAESVTGRSAV